MEHGDTTFFYRSMLSSSSTDDVMFCFVFYPLASVCFRFYVSCFIILNVLEFCSRHLYLNRRGKARAHTTLLYVTFIQSDRIKKSESPLRVYFFKIANKNCRLLPIWSLIFVYIRCVCRVVFAFTRRAVSKRNAVNESLAHFEKKTQRERKKSSNGTHRWTEFNRI